MAANTSYLLPLGSPCPSLSDLQTPCPCRKSPLCAATGGWGECPVSDGSSVIAVKPSLAHAWTGLVGSLSSSRLRGFIHFSRGFLVATEKFLAHSIRRGRGGAVFSMCVLYRYCLVMSSVNLAQLVNRKATVLPRFPSFLLKTLFA